MSNYTRFIYAATSTALPSTIRQHLIEITQICETLNNIEELSGVLIYGNNTFLHCLEGSEEQINKFHQMSLESPYTKDFLLLKRELIAAKAFRFWNIKYFIKEAALQQFLLKWKQDNFNPYNIQGDILDEFVQVIIQNQEAVNYTFLEQYENITAESATKPSGSFFTSNYFFVGISLILILTLVFFMTSYFEHHSLGFFHP
ncbi:MAG: hypothetical protein EOO69_04250 [Moraxellaceae bacterium]|nr:MAG: hypothetical protein EOO69_04250 [Moraxellaceae bacterium]